MTTLRDKIKEKQDLEQIKLYIDEWECHIEIKTMTAKQRAKILNVVMDDSGKIDNDTFHVMMIIASCFDPDTGEQIFEESDAEWIMNKAAGPIERIMSNVMKVSGLSKTSAEEAEKNCL